MGIIEQWNEEVEKVKCEICDEYCRFPREIEDEYELLEKCEKWMPLPKPYKAEMESEE